NRRIPANSEQPVELEFLVYKKLYNKGVNDRYRRRLGRSKDTSIDTAEDKNREEKRPYAIFENFQGFFEGVGSFRFPAMLSGLVEGITYKTEAYENTGQKPGHEHLCHGYVH